MKKFLVDTNKLGFDVGLAIWEHFNDGSGMRYGMVEFEDVENVYTRRPPSLHMSRQEAQQLMDALYDAGFRPTGIQDSNGELKATKRHLEDMRNLVFNGEKA